jgi:uracil-DNA glycosylase
MTNESLLASIRACELCRAVLPVEPRPVLQFHASARILIASQAPGRIVFETGVPFNDASGERLRGWLGVTREQFYDERLFAIAPMGFCYPGSGRSGDLPPRPECAKQWRRPLLDALSKVELVLAVGRYAIGYHLGRKRSLTETLVDRRGWPPDAMPLPHPSPRNNGWLRRNEWFERDRVPELRARVRAIVLGPRSTSAGRPASADEEVPQ